MTCRPKSLPRRRVPPGKVRPLPDRACAAGAESLAEAVP
jgi:hypothetical protein